MDQSAAPSNGNSTLLEKLGGSDNTVIKEANERMASVPKIEYTPEELAYRGELINKMILARNMRDRSHPELDGMTLIEYYESNRKKDLSYLPPKKNKNDVRIVTGTTREKDSTIVSSMLSMNFKGDVTAFDVEDLMVASLGNNMGDWVHKSREIEDWESKRSSFYRELASQGDVFGEEIWKEMYRNEPTAKMSFDPTKDDPKEFKLSEMPKKIMARAEVRMVNAKKLYPFNIRIQNVKEQPGCAVLNIYSRSEAKAIYGTWKRWENVPYNIQTTEAYFPDGTTYKDWNLTGLEDTDRVAELKIWLPHQNRYMIMLNGVMMLPIDYPLTAVSPTGEINIAHGKFEPITDFFYSKSLPSKTKIDQEVLDEATKISIEWFRQLVRPTKGASGNKTYSKNIYTAGKIIHDIKEGELFNLFPDTAAAGNSIFSFYKMFKDSIAEKTVSDNFSGEQGGEQTATETIELKQQQMMKLGLGLDGVVNFERQLMWNRIQNLCVHWTDKDDKSVSSTTSGITEGYKDFSVHTEVDNGAKGVKMFRLRTKGENIPAVADQEHEEDQLSKKYNKPVRIVYINPDMLRSLRYRWFIVVTPSPASNDKLTQLMFIQNVGEALQTFGPDALNMEYIKQRWAVVIGENYEKFFKKMSIQDMIQAGGKSNPAVSSMLQGGGAPAAANGQAGAKPIVSSKVAVPGQGSAFGRPSLLNK